MATKASKGFGVTCPFCGGDGDESTVSLDLNKLEEIHCTNCDQTFSATEARDKVTVELARWERVVRFIEVGCAIARGDA